MVDLELGLDVRLGFQPDDEIRPAIDREPVRSFRMRKKFCLFVQRVGDDDEAHMEEQGQ